MDETRPVVLVVQHEDVVPVCMLGGWLADAGCDVQLVRPDRGEPLPSPRAAAGAEAYDALVVLGGTVDSWDEAGHPWLPATRSLIREAADHLVPVLGICLGHQLAAQAYGGDVGRNPAGSTAAVLPVGWREGAEDDPLLGGIARERGPQAVAVHHNSDVVLSMPAGAVQVAAALDGTPQAVRFAESAWGVQCHPEADAALVRVWEAHGDRTPREEVIEEVAAAMPQLVATWQPLAPALAGLAHARRARRRSELLAERDSPPASGALA